MDVLGSVPIYGAIVVSSDLAPAFGLAILFTLLLAGYSEDLDEGRSTRAALERSLAGQVYRQGSRASRISTGTHWPDRPGGGEPGASEPRASRLGRAFRSLLALLHLAAVVAALTLPWGAHAYGGPLGDLLHMAPGSISEEPFHLSAFVVSLCGPLTTWKEWAVAGIVITTVMVAPLLRSLTQLALLHVPMPMQRARLLFRFSKHLTYIYGLQVFTFLWAALALSGTNLAATLTLPVPESLFVAFNETWGTDAFTVIFEARPGLYAAGFAVFLAFFSAFDGSETHKYIHALLYAGEDCPPYTACGPSGKRVALRLWREHARPRDRLDHRSG